MQHFLLKYKVHVPGSAASASSKLVRSSPPSKPRWPLPSQSPEWSTMQESINTKRATTDKVKNKQQSTWATARSELPSSDLCAASKAFSWGKIISDYSALLCWLCRFRKYYAHRCNRNCKESDWKNIIHEVMFARNSYTCKRRYSLQRAYFSGP